MTNGHLRVITALAVNFGVAMITGSFILATVALVATLILVQPR